MTPHPYGTKIILVPGGRHELLDAYVVSSCQTRDGGHRYHCVFPCSCGARWANVYSNEIEHAGDVDEAMTRQLMEQAR